MDDRFDDLLRDAAREYNEPPDTPRDIMWERIVAERAEKAEEAELADKPAARVLPFRSIRSGRSFRIAAGIAAVLALGIGLGRLSAPTPPSRLPLAPVAVQPGAPRANTVAYDVAAREYLGQSEAFLTLFRASLHQRTGNQQLAVATARQLLATNRLLLDSPAAEDSKTKLLLQDLELVLAQIAQLSPESRTRDLDLITEGLERAAVMTRLRTAVPSGPSTTQGAL